MSQILEFPSSLTLDAIDPLADGDSNNDNDLLGLDDPVNPVEVAGDVVGEANGEAVNGEVTNDQPTNNEPAGPAADAGVTDSSGTVFPPVQPSEGNAAGPDNSERQFHADQIHKAETYLSTCVIEYNRLREQTKAAKKRIDLAAESLEELRAESWDSDDVENLPAEFNVVEDGGSAVSPTAISPLPVDSSDNAWRAVSTTAIGLQRIKGMGKKKIDNILEVAPTLGQLEDLRAAAGFAGFASVLPKGIGDEMASDIEAAMLDWFSSNRDRKVLEAAAVGSVANESTASEAAESAEAPAESDTNNETSEAADDVQPEAANPETDESETDNESSPYLTARAAELNTGKPDSLMPSTGSAACKPWESGYEAAQRNWKLTDCPYEPGVEQDDWLKGFMAMAAVEANEGKLAGAEGGSGNGKEEKPKRQRRVKKRPV